MFTIRRSGFTLIELLVVIAIIAILIALLVPGVQKVREAAARTQCANNLKQLALAMQTYHGEHKAFPPGARFATAHLGDDGESTAFPYLLPYIEGGNIVTGYDVNQTWRTAVNQPAVQVGVPAFVCPSNSGGLFIDTSTYTDGTYAKFLGKTDYALCRGASGILYWDWNQVPLASRGVFNLERHGLTKARVRLQDITDGSSNTMAMGDAACDSPIYKVRNPFTNAVTNGKLVQAWGAPGFSFGSGAGLYSYFGSIFAVTAQSPTVPEPMNLNPATPTHWSQNQTTTPVPPGTDFISGFRSNHAGGCNFAFCDGTVRFLLSSINATTYQALSTYAGNEVASDD